MSDEITLIQNKEQMIRDYLDHPKKNEDPVKIKHLEITVGHLDNILMYIDCVHDAQSGQERKTLSLISILKQIDEPIEKISTYSAWELSDLLEIELIRLGDDIFLYTLLKAQKRDNNTDPHRWEKHFPAYYLDTLLYSYVCGKFSKDCHRLEARCFLEHLKQAQIEEYRYDRTKIELRGIYLSKIRSILFYLVPLLSIFYILSSLTGDNRIYLVLPLVLFAGAIGSVLSRAYKVGKQPLHADTDNKTREPPLGIRALISEQKVLKTLPIIGAAAALILYFVFNAGLFNLGVIKPEAYALIAFLAGFSEVYFIGIIDKVAGQTGGSLR